ncbi:MAG: HEAT repeat domain-containing protein, partial [Gemmatimonadaceae bacterium]
QRPSDPMALNALIGATRNDRSWGVRSRAVDAIGAWGSDSGRSGAAPMRQVMSALVTATRDPDARVRQQSATALGRLVLPAASTRDITIRLRELARTDPNIIVRGAALASDIRLEKNAAIPFAKQLMANDVWQSVIRTPAVNALKETGTPEALQLAQQYAPASQ